MVYAFLADAVAFFHLSFVVFAALGGLFVIRWRPAAWMHIPAVVAAFLAGSTGWICPLTPIENRLLDMAGETGYQGGFLNHYLFSILYPPGLTRTVQFIMAASLLTFNILVYWRAFTHRPSN